MSSKGSLERSKKKIDKICTMRSLPPFKMYMADIDVKDLAEVLDPSVWYVIHRDRMTTTISTLVQTWSRAVIVSIEH